MASKENFETVHRVTMTQVTSTPIVLGQVNVVDDGSSSVTTMINRSVSSSATFYTYVYPDEGTTGSSGLRGSTVQKNGKYIVAETTHSPGKVLITVPVNLIPLVADVYSSSETVPTSLSSLNGKFLTRMYTSDGTTVAYLQLGFALKATSSSSSDYYLYTYVRNNSSASRNMKVYFIN